MHIFDKDIADLYLSNVDDPICDDRNCTSQCLNPHMCLKMGEGKSINPFSLDAITAFTIEKFGNFNIFFIK